MVCSKRGNQSKNCPGKAKFIKNTGRFIIYEKCINKNNNHLYLDFEKFKEIYYSNNYEKMDMKIRLMQKFFITCLLSDNKITTYTDGVTEATDAHNVLFGNDRLLEALNKDPDADTEQICKNVKESINEFVGEAPQFDDITMLCVKFN